MVKHRKTKTIYALKKIPKQMIKSHFMVDQLALEIKLQTYLNHKNVLEIYNFFDNSTHLFIVLEYMDQGTLYSQLKKNKILPELKAAQIIKQITEAVEYLHDHDIAHRDIKPQNIVISNVLFNLVRMYANYVISDGPQFAMRGEKHTAELLTMLLLRSLKEKTMTGAQIYGVLVF